jgi:hypothetical protein
LGLGIKEGRDWGVIAWSWGKERVAFQKFRGWPRKEDVFYLHEQFDLGLFFGHGCVGDQEAAVAGGTGRGPGLRKAGLTVRGFSSPDLRLSLQHNTNPISPVPSRYCLSTGQCTSHPAPPALYPPRLALGAADSPVCPALNLGRGQDRAGLETKGVGPEGRSSGLSEAQEWES